MEQTIRPDEEAPDDVLMARTAEGDRSAFQILMRRYDYRLYNYLRRLTGNVHDAEDLVQETFIKVYRSAARFRPSASAKPWIYRIGTNLATDLLRKKKRRRETALTAAPPDESASGADPRAAAINAELGSTLKEAVANLPEKQRIVFLMARYESLSYAEIAESLRIPLGTVKSRLNAAVTALLDAIERADR